MKDFPNATDIHTMLDYHQSRQDIRKCRDIRRMCGSIDRSKRKRIDSRRILFKRGVKNNGTTASSSVKQGQNISLYGRGIGGNAGNSQIYTSNVVEKGKESVVGHEWYLHSNISNSRGIVDTVRSWLVLRGMIEMG